MNFLFIFTIFCVLISVFSEKTIQCPLCKKKFEEKQKRIVPIEKDGILLEFNDGMKIGDGADSQVFHAVMTKNDQKMCVALKITKMDGQKLEQSQRHEWEVLEAFNSVQHREHIVKLLAKYEHDKKLFTALEFGTMNYEKYIENLHENKWNPNFKFLKSWKDDKHFLKEIQKVVEVVKQMHQRIIHFDLKPPNLVILKEQNGEEILKAIDFGGSYIMNEEEQADPNACILMDSQKVRFTPAYASPEQMTPLSMEEAEKLGVDFRRVEKVVKLSQKSDIWAIGVILLDIVSKDLQEAVKIGKITIYSTLPDGSPKKIESHDDLIQWMMTWFKKKPLNLEEWKELLLQTGQWSYVSHLLKLLLEIRKCCPGTFKLLLLTFKQNPKKRPDTKEILRFLAKDCKFDEQEDGKSVEILPGLHLNDLEAILKEAEKSFTKKEMAQKLLKLYNKHAKENVQKPDVEICETSNVNEVEEGKEECACRY